MQKNALDTAIEYFAPQWALARAAHRQRLHAYESLQPGPFRSPARTGGSGDLIVSQSLAGLRNQARYYERNYDMVAGTLDRLVARVVGDHLAPEPMVRLNDGTLAADFNREIRDAFEGWAKRCDVSGGLAFDSAMRLACRTWLRDGEFFAKHFVGPVSNLDHGTDVPYSIELIEPDLCDETLDDPDRGILMGITHNAWHQATMYHMHRVHPEGLERMANLGQRTKHVQVPGSQISHIALATRIYQSRGLSVLASTFQRLEDIKDYEESERIAARDAATNTTVIQRDVNMQWSPTDTSLAANEQYREFAKAPGMVWDNLLPGETVKSAESTRPSALLQPFMQTMMRAFAAGARSSYSSVSRDYNGTFSAQRQELVESTGDDRILFSELHCQQLEPIYRRFLQAAIAARVVRPSRDIDPTTLFKTHWQAPQMPWVDPVKEAKAQEILHGLGAKSLIKIIREGGGTDDPYAVLEQVLKEWEQFGRKSGGTEAPAPDPEDEDDEEAADPEDANDDEDDQEAA